MDWVVYLSGQALSAILFIPWIVPFAFSVVTITKTPDGRWGKQFVPVTFGFWLTFWQAALWVFQIAFNMARVNPLDQATAYYGFPSMAGFYVAVLGSFVIEFTFVWNIQFSWTYWAALFLWWICPGVVLVFTTYNTWQEVVLSLGWGVLVTTIYVLVLRFYIFYELPFYLNSEPFTWFSCVDTWLQSAEQQVECERIRLALAGARRKEPFLAWWIQRHGSQRASLSS